MDKSKVEELLERAWTLFENQADCETDGLVEAALYFSSQHDFDIEVLPPKLYDRVAEKIKQEAAAAYEDDKIL